MSFYENIIKCKSECLKDSYGVKSSMGDWDPENTILISDLVLTHKTGKPINQEDYIIISREDYYKRLKAFEKITRLNLCNELLLAEDKCCIKGCKE